MAVCSIEEHVRREWLRRELGELLALAEKFEAEDEYQQSARETLAALVAVEESRLVEEIRDQHLYYQRHDWTAQYGQAAADVYAHAYCAARHYGLEVAA